MLHLITRDCRIYIRFVCAFLIGFYVKIVMGMSPALNEEEKEKHIQLAANRGNCLVCSELKLLFVIMEFIADGLRSYACPCTWRTMQQLNDSSEMLLDCWSLGFFTFSLLMQNRRVFWPAKVNVFNGIGRIMNLSMHWRGVSSNKKMGFFLLKWHIHANERHTAVKQFIWKFSGKEYSDRQPRSLFGTMGIGRKSTYF